MADSLTQSHVRGLQQVWVPEHACWVMVWCADDGELDRNHRLAYAVVSSPAEFQPQAGQFVLTKETTSDWTYVYGVPYKLEAINGVLKCYFQDLTPALGWPRFATGESSPSTSSNGKSGTKFGMLVEGQFARESLLRGPILWNLKDQNLHNNPTPVLEAADTASVDDGTQPFGAPCGTMIVEYQRDATGRIKTDSQGFPKIAFVDPTESDTQYTAQNFKIGYLALTFQKDYFGVGLHGWIGAAGAGPKPFDIIRGSANNTVRLRPGTVNNLMPSNMFTDLPLNSNGTKFMVVACETDGQQVNAAEVELLDTQPIPPTPLLGGPPASFKVLIGVLIVTGGAAKTYTPYKLWPDFNISARPVEWIRTDKASPSPGQSRWDIWYNWSINAAVDLNS